ncbi:MAG: hypothetical protein WA814_11610 [Candidatus Baltobacteraceae bacterium]
MSLLLAALTLNPAVMPHAGTGATEGYIEAEPTGKVTNCKPGAICAFKKTTLHGCFVNNVWNSSKGGTPLAIDISETGGAGSTTWVYWVNNTNQTLGITGNATAHFYCPPSS